MKARRRRADDARYLAKDAKAWGRLVRAAFTIVRAPLAPSDPLRRAAEACGRAVPPPGHARRDSDFLALMALGQLWWRLAPSVRAEKSDRLKSVAEACAEALDRAVPTDAAPDLSRRRLDIWG